MDREVPLSPRDATTGQCTNVDGHGSLFAGREEIAVLSGDVREDRAARKDLVAKFFTDWHSVSSIRIWRETLLSLG